ncbi:MAG: hypothetical protein ACE5IM_12875, partial [Nitrospinota bacterium]
MKIRFWRRTRVRGVGPALSLWLLMGVFVGGLAPVPGAGAATERKLLVLRPATAPPKLDSLLGNSPLLVQYQP